MSETDQEKSAEELVNEYPGLDSSLKINHDGPKMYFKVGVKSRQESKKEAENRVKDEEKRILKKFELKMKALKTSMDTAIDTAVSNAEKTAREAKQTEDQILVAAETAKKTVLDQYKTQIEEEPPTLENKEKKLKQKWVVKKPLKYSDPEYSKFIFWILANL